MGPAFSSGLGLSRRSGVISIEGLVLSSRGAGGGRLALEGEAVSTLRLSRGGKRSLLELAVGIGVGGSGRLVSMGGGGCLGTELSP